jgi:hypothetical protein
MTKTEKIYEGILTVLIFIIAFIPVVIYGAVFGAYTCTKAWVVDFLINNFKRIGGV